MRIEKAMITTIMYVFMVPALVLGQKTLDYSEIEQIITTLTSTPRNVWLEQGTVRITRNEHQYPRVADSAELNHIIQEKTMEYQSSTNKIEIAPEMQAYRLQAIPFNTRYALQNESTTVTAELLKIDGDKFSSDIYVESHSDTIKPDASVAGNPCVRYIDYTDNKHRIIAHNGQILTRYYVSMDQAVIEESYRGSTINTAMQAGIVPWGYGLFTRKNLLDNNPSGYLGTTGNREEVHMTIQPAPDLKMEVVLDPAKDYALLGRTTYYNGRISCTALLSGLVLIDGKWIPTEIYEEIVNPDDQRLLKSDFWRLEILDAGRPSSNSFQVDMKDQTFIKYLTPLSAHPIHYYYRSGVDVEDMLAKRLAVLATKGIKRNCATVVLKDVTETLGKPLSDQQLTTIIDASGYTSLADMQDILRAQGLYCQAVKTDLNGLRQYSDCQVILYLPGISHYVLLESIDNQYVWTIDISSNRLYKRTSVDFFEQDWANGVAMLVSDHPKSVNDAVLSAQELAETVGASGYSCTDLLQSNGTLPCSYTIPSCVGNAYIFYRVLGCEAASSGYCDDSQVLILYETRPCVIDPGNPLNCVVSYDFGAIWYTYGCDGFAPGDV